MTDRNANRLGYRKTRVGWIPDDWDCKYLRDIGSFKNGISKSADQFGSGFPIVNIRLLFEENRVVLPPDDLVESSISERKSFNLKKGDVLFVRSSVKLEGVGLTAVVEKDLTDTVYSGFIIRFRPKQKVFLTKSARYLFDNYQFRKNLLRKSTVSANTNINQPSLGSLKIQLPPLDEQHKIAEILSTWDRAIEQTRELIDAKQRFKRGLMQQLLTGRLRFPGFEGKRNLVELGNIVKILRNGLTYETKNQSGKPITRIETISDGVIDVSRTGYITDEEIDKHYRLEKGDILYSHINSLAHIGKVAIFTGNQEIYHGMNLLMIRPDDEIIEPVFLFFLLKSEVGERIAYRLAKRAVNQCSINTTELKKEKIQIPILSEQKKIARILFLVDLDLEFLESKVQRFEKQKSGLMQQLLLGEIRL